MSKFEISADELDHLLFLNFYNDLPGKGLAARISGGLLTLRIMKLRGTGDHGPCVAKFFRSLSGQKKWLPPVDCYH
jgi:hypothetical protein